MQRKKACPISDVLRLVGGTNMILESLKHPSNISYKLGEKRTNATRIAR